MRACLLTALALMSACDVTDSERITAACTTLCACNTVQLPAAQERCIASCSAEIDVDLSDECLACVSSHERTCTTLERDCEFQCNPPDPVFVEGAP